MQAQSSSSSQPQGMETGINEYEKLPTKEKKKLHFLMGLYPDGRTLDDIIKQIERVKKCTASIAEERTKSQLMDYEIEKLITAVEKEGKIMIYLTKLGNDKISDFLLLLKEHFKEKFFVYLRDWAMKGDKDAEKAYEKEVTKLFLLEPQISCMLMIPHFESDIINEYAKLNGKKADGEIATNVLKYLSMLDSIGFVKYRAETVKGKSMRIYYLTKEGKVAINITFKHLKKYIEKKNDGGTTNQGNVIDPKKKRWIYWFAMILSFITGLLAWSGAGGLENLEMLSAISFSSVMGVFFVIMLEYLLPKFMSLFSFKKNKP